MHQQDVKPSREVKVGDSLTIWRERVPQTVVVQGISEKRGPAPIAQQLYVETLESIQRRAQAAENRRLSPEPALTIEHGRPTKRDRRDMEKGWNNRWGASLEP
jgi:ribosome-associated heat shock protein Hsp15